MSNEKLYWTMKNGEKIDVDQMTESHLRNTLKLIIRRSQQVQNTCPHNIEDAMDMANYDDTPFCDDWIWK